MKKNLNFKSSRFLIKDHESDESEDDSILKSDNYFNDDVNESDSEGENLQNKDGYTDKNKSEEIINKILTNFKDVDVDKNVLINNFVNGEEIPEKNLNDENLTSSLFSKEHDNTINSVVEDGKNNEEFKTVSLQNQWLTDQKVDKSLLMCTAEKYNNTNDNTEKSFFSTLVINPQLNDYNDVTAVPSKDHDSESEKSTDDNEIETRLDTFLSIDHEDMTNKIVNNNIEVDEFKGSEKLNDDEEKEIAETLLEINKGYKKDNDGVTIKNFLNNISTESERETITLQSIIEDNKKIEPNIFFEKPKVDIKEEVKKKVEDEFNCLQTETNSFLFIKCLNDKLLNLEELNSSELEVYRMISYLVDYLVTKVFFKQYVNNKEHIVKLVQIKTSFTKMIYFICKDSIDIFCEKMKRNKMIKIVVNLFTLLLPAIEIIKTNNNDSYKFVNNEHFNYANVVKEENNLSKYIIENSRDNKYLSQDVTSSNILNSNILKRRNSDSVSDEYEIKSSYNVNYYDTNNRISDFSGGQKSSSMFKIQKRN